MSETLWGVEDVAREMGVGLDSARYRLRVLRDRGHLTATYGPHGALLYRPVEVRAAWSRLPGQGRRTDLRRGRERDDAGPPAGRT
ncbi:hypothetical protein [Pseudonocardia asaccharolytica]|uniref:Uncharacterized protein n=1 Tax=Pseudonocardia asaccharolytica DSM 44247 = NBRC 16224 TaxID=1123024 RepID=A0A511CYS9_9PSEU|nr:hypothetical protein [Pseudonocardia asaccharolytica]GEL17710.1 hypothetical protein PA7_15470 [Pseudonocardia asaccharolytica DSM 44247 = NBRC 16224]